MMSLKPIGKKMGDVLHVKLTISLSLKYSSETFFRNIPQKHKYYFQRIIPAYNQ